MKLAGIDANLLAALDALLCEKSVTRAARRLGVGQPAVSHALSRLRNYFRDELLVLNGRDYVLTARAEKLASVVANATRALSEVFEETPSFDAATSSYRFVVACSDLFGVLVIPELLRTLKREAENVEVELRAVVATSKESVLADGVDLALGIFEDVPLGINQQSLYDDPAVCVVRADHGQVGTRLTLETYGQLPHLEIGPVADAISELHIDRALAAIGTRRHITLRVPYFLLAPHILEHTDHVATLSAGGAEVLSKMARLRVLEPPIELPAFAILRSGKTRTITIARTLGCAIASRGSVKGTRRRPIPPEALREPQLLEPQLVDVTPGPLVAWLDGTRNRVVRGAKVFDGVLVLRGITAADVPALHAHAQLLPGLPQAQAIDAARAAGLYDTDVREV